jgi:hypothetical protein
MQGFFAMRLYRLQQAVESSRLEPRLFCRVKGREVAGIFSTLEAQLSNLSTYGVWVDELVVILNGPVLEPRFEFRVEAVLAASETKQWTLFAIPFANIVPLGTSGTVAFKLQVKFHYSTSTTIGIQVSPVYDVAISGTVVRSMKPENEATTS